mmetsp:Transcript_9489/g.15250  ORF Transcript_9489/g.15250 Transcript_9489/m.15250 type:complete len:125 (-) Transcript_9489:398-772(-)|eukprot:CAMPEP_0178736948 /NCGR_PEP_ID=MMETSP0744-20121128/2714_1 /TAXON_ID=913974 /ORGANISM="Nitzschia punctata, Strain CCMP561" /LENGTH=124 /DNA_ID=CAMNT_0020389459 /DNA_START=55 /DNA_END=429 /DNA_ORIENTATION=+
MFTTSPATQALELVQAKMMSSKGSRRGSLNSVDSKLSCDLFNLNFEDLPDAFPVIQWESNEDSDSESESVRSLDSIFLTDFESGSDVLGKRGRNDSGQSRRLVRSKKIKADLSSLARNMAARSA